MGRTGFYFFILLMPTLAKAGCLDLVLEPINQRVHKVMSKEFAASEGVFEKKFRKSVKPAFDEFSGELLEEELVIKFNNNPVLTEIFNESLRALGKMELLRQSLDRVPPDEKQYFLEIYQASWSALIKHLDVYSHGALKTLDVPRYLKILREISNFNGDKPEFSFFKIKRSIEERYSLKEFLYCR